MNQNQLAMERLRGFLAWRTPDIKWETMTNRQVMEHTPPEVAAMFWLGAYK